MIMACSVVGVGIKPIIFIKCSKGLFMMLKIGSGIVIAKTFVRFFLVNIILYHHLKKIKKLCWNSQEIRSLA